MRSDKFFLMCRTLTLVKSGTGSFQGISGNVFTSSKDMFDNGTNVPSRKCYCINSECQPSGTLNISTCRYGAPAFISLPHFYLSDESYRSAVSGMKPNKDAHEFRILIDQVKKNHKLETFQLLILKMLCFICRFLVFR